MLETIFLLIVGFILGTLGSGRWNRHSTNTKADASIANESIDGFTVQTHAATDAVADENPKVNVEITDSVDRLSVRDYAQSSNTQSPGAQLPSQSNDLDSHKSPSIIHSADSIATQSLPSNAGDPSVCDDRGRVAPLVKNRLAPENVADMSLLSINTVEGKQDTRQANFEVSGSNELGPNSILWQIKDGICVRDMQGNLLSYNPAWLAIWDLETPSEGQYTRVQMLGCYREDGISPLPQDEAPMYRALEGHTVNNQKIIIDNHNAGVTDADGVPPQPGCNARTYFVSGYPLIDETGEQYAAFVIMRDVTERTEAVTALARERSLLRNILEVIPDGFVLRDMSGKAILHNEAYRQKRGPFNVQSFVERPMVANLFDPDNDKALPDYACPMFRALSGEGFVNQLVYLRKSDGVKVDLLISGYPLYNDNNEQIGAFTLERDITDVKRAAQLRARSSRLAALGMVVGGVAHDFNNQLSAIMGNVQVARLMLQNSKQVDHHLKAIEEVAATSAELVRRLTSIGVRPSGAVELMDVCEFLKEIAPVLNGMFENKQAIEVDAGDEPLMVICEKSQLESAVLSLLLNANEAVDAKNPEQPRITLSARRTVYDNVCWNSGLRGAFIEIEVTDNGCGMSEETVERAKEIEFSTKATNDEAGLGLPMVSGFARQNGGDAHIESQLSVGTRVLLALPEAGDHVMAANDKDSSQLQIGNHQTILVVDDDPALLATMREMLTALKYDVICARDGHTALDIIGGTNTISLAIIDIMLPDGLNGDEVARQAIAVRPELAVLFISGYVGSMTNSHDALDWPLMQKPVALAGLASMVAEMVPDYAIEEATASNQVRLH